MGFENATNTNGVPQLFCCIVGAMADHINYCLARITTTMFGVVREQHNLDIIANKTRRGGAHLLIEYSAGKYNDNWNKLANIVATREGMFDGMGFPRADEHWHPCVSEEEEEVIAMQAMRFLLRLLGHRILTFLAMSHSMPGALFALLHHDETIRTSTLEGLEVWWDVWQKAEAAAFKSSFVSEWLRNVVW